jgi:uncharacterized membrane protein
MIWVILIITTIIRLIGINQSLWLDEAISTNVAKLPIGQIISNFSVVDFHPPLYYWFLNFWIKFFGSTVLAMRLSSVLFSLITIWLVYKIGKEIKDKNLGLWAALFVGVNPLLIYYSQELRMYSMTVMLLIGAFYFFVKLNKKYNWKDVVGFGILTGLSFATFYGSIFLTGAMILYFLINKKWKLFWLSCIGIVVAMLAVSPLLLIQLKMSGQMLNQVTNWSLVLGKVNLKNLLLIPFKFTVGRISWYPKIFYYLVCGIWAAFVWLIALKNSKKEKYLVWLMTIPLVLGIIFSFKSPMIQYFRFLYLVPILAIMLSKEKNKIIKLILSAGFLTFSLFYVLNPTMHREDWKGVVESLINQEKVYMVKSFEDPVKFYNPEIQIVDIRPAYRTGKSQISDKNIWVIPYGEIIHGVNHTEILEKAGYQREEQINFREIVLEKWQKI